MFSLKVQNIDGLTDRMKKRFEKVVQDPALLSEVGKTVVDDVRFQTRKGNSIPLKSKLRPLSKKWIDLRERIAKTQGADDSFGNKRSNLTLSGQLLNSLNAKVTERKSGGSKLSIGFEGNHEPYRVQRLPFWKVRSFKRGSSRVRAHYRGNPRPDGSYQIGRTLTNAKLAKYVEERGRPFVGVRDQIKTRLRTLVLRAIRRSR